MQAKFELKLLLLLVGLTLYLFSNFTYAETHVSGHITEDTVWDISDSPYILTNDLTVDVGVSLSIQPNVEIDSQHSSYRILINGNLFASECIFSTVKIYVNRGGESVFQDCYSSGPDVYFQDGSAGSISNCTGSWDVDVNSSSVTFAGSCEFGYLRIYCPGLTISGHSINYLVVDFEGATDITNNVLERIEIYNLNDSALVHSNTFTSTAPIWIKEPDADTNGIFGNSYIGWTQMILLYGQLDSTKTFESIDGISKYNIYGAALTVSSSAVCTFESGMAILSGNFVIEGGLVADNVQIDGDFQMEPGSFVELTDCSANSYAGHYADLEFDGPAASGATVEMHDCYYPRIRINKNLVFTIRDNTFTDQRPIVIKDPATDTSGVEGNIYAHSDPYVDFDRPGTLSKDLTLSDLDGLKKYRIYYFEVPVDKTLIIHEGLEIIERGDIVVDGSIIANNVNFNGQNITLKANANSYIDFWNCTFNGPTLELSDTAKIFCAMSSFVSSTKVWALGDPCNTIDLDNNWWGTTDTSEIENMVFHQNDYPDRPWIKYEPFLTSLPTNRIWLPSDPPDPIIPENLEAIEPNTPSKDKLIVVVHGWAPSLDFGWLSPEFETEWSVDMCHALWDLIDDGSMDSSWDVIPWSWYDQAFTYSPDLALSGGIEQGKRLAQSIIDANCWQHVHLIGFSAGACVIGTAADELINSRNKAEFDASIHLTFLDAYTPIGEENQYGRLLDFSRDWAENYYTVDRTCTKGLKSCSDFLHRWTSRDFSYAHNVNISEKNSGSDYHGFPHEWYHATITGKYPNGDDLEDDNIFEGYENCPYGFPRSLEAGDPNWQKSLTLPVGNEPIGSPALWDKLKTGYKKTKDKIIDIANSAIKRSVTGVVKIYFDINKMIMGSGSPVWCHIFVEMPKNANYMKFDYQLTGEGDGYLTAYFNESLIVLADQRFDSNNLHNSGEIYVGDMMEGYNWLTLRLDPITEQQASVIVSAIEVGTITNKADINNNLAVNFEDFSAFAIQWEKTECNELNNWCQECDLDESGAVDSNDLIILSNNWLWKPAERVEEDLNYTGTVDLEDIGIFINQWLNECDRPDWCYGCDLDKSNKVNFADFAQIAEKWLVEY